MNRLEVLDYLLWATTTNGDNDGDRRMKIVVGVFGKKIEKAIDKVVLNGYFHIYNIDILQQHAKTDCKKRYFQNTTRKWSFPYPLLIFIFYTYLFSIAIWFFNCSFGKIQVVFLLILTVLHNAIIYLLHKKLDLQRISYCFSYIMLFH